MDHSTALDLSALHSTFAGQVLQRLQTLVDPLVLVGGSVRDLALGRELHDLDLVVPAGGLQLARRAADEFQGAYVPLDERRDTGRAVLGAPGGQTLVVDVAAWRGPSLADDLAARDFTINALAAEVRGVTAQILDVTGGLSDLEARVLRTTSPQALPDDPLRCLRAVRLLAELSPWGMRLEQDTGRQIRRYARLLPACASERVRDELVRTLAAANPVRWLAVLSRLGLLAVVLPEAEALRGVDQSEPHFWDVFDHTARVVAHAAWLAGWIAGRNDPADAFDAAACRTLAPHRQALARHLAEPVGVSLGDRGGALRWAALCHDWGKPATRALADAPEGNLARVRFLGHEDVSVSLSRDALRRLRFSEAETRWVTAIVAGHMRPHHLVAAGQPSRRAIYRYFRDLDAAGVDTALLSLADVRATAGPTLQPEVWQRQLDLAAALIDAFFNRPLEAVRPEPVINGNDLMTALMLRPGRLVGQLLEAVAEAQAAGELAGREQALAYARQLAEDETRLERGFAHGN
jgi:tRNA nucleotidyltransferase/poly(A) polymerase